MKKLHVLGCILLLFAIWLNTFSWGGSNLPELFSIIFAAGGLICGIVSLFVKDK